MNEIKCPKCGEFFRIDEAGYAAILKQVHDKEFEKELDKKRAEFDKEKESAVDMAVIKAEVEKEKKISEHKAQYIALGYDEKLATETAQAISEGNIELVFANQKKFLEAHDKAYKAQLMGGTPTPPAGGANGDVMTLDKFRNLSPEARHEFSVKNPEEYERLYNGGNN